MPRIVVQLFTVLFAAAAIAGAVYFSIANAGPLARSWDEVDFALALDRYDLLAMQPHFPGYPYFILGATFVHRLVADPIEALSVFNALASLSAVIPMVLLARRYMGGRWTATAGRRQQSDAFRIPLLPAPSPSALALMFAALVSTSPYLWLMSARPMSECAGIAALWWFLWSVRAAMGRPAFSVRHALVLLTFSVLMGIRLSFFPFGLVLLLLWVEHFRRGDGSRGRKWTRLVLSVTAAGLFQLVWVAGLVMSEGSLAGFWKLALAFVEGHFSDWGGGVVSSPVPFGERFVRLFADNLLWHALLSRSAAIGILFALLLAVVAIGVWDRVRRKWNLDAAAQTRSRNPDPIAGNSPVSRPDADEMRTNRRFMVWLALSIGGYALWVFIGQNIEKPRHITPVVGALLLFVYVGVVRTASLWSKTREQHQQDCKPLWRAAVPLLAYAVIAVLISTQFIYGHKLLQRQADETPAVYQLHAYLNRLDEPFVLYTWEETRVLQYLHAQYDHQRIYTFDYFKDAVQADPGRRVLLTDHVVQGFELQGYDIHAHVKPVAAFESDALFEPVYHDITLYEWMK